MLWSSEYDWLFSVFQGWGNHFTWCLLPTFLTNCRWKKQQKYRCTPILTTIKTFNYYNYKPSRRGLKFEYVLAFSFPFFEIEFLLMRRKQSYHSRQGRIRKSSVERPMPPPCWATNEQTNKRTKPGSAQNEHVYTFI